MEYLASNLIEELTTVFISRNISTDTAYIAILSLAIVHL